MTDLQYVQEFAQDYFEDMINTCIDLLESKELVKSTFTTFLGQIRIGVDFITRIVEENPIKPTNIIPFLIEVTDNKQGVRVVLSLEFNNNDYLTKITINDWYKDIQNISIICCMIPNESN